MTTHQPRARTVDAPPCQAVRPHDLSGVNALVCGACFRIVVWWPSRLLDYLPMGLMAKAGEYANQPRFCS